MRAFIWGAAFGFLIANTALLALAFFYLGYLLAVTAPFASMVFVAIAFWWCLVCMESVRMWREWRAW